MIGRGMRRRQQEEEATGGHRPAKQSGAEKNDGHGQGHAQELTQVKAMGNNSATKSELALGWLSRSPGRPDGCTAEGTIGRGVVSESAV